LQEERQVNALRDCDARFQRREIPRSDSSERGEPSGAFHDPHVQDGGSKDGTLQILAAWKSRLARDASAPDRGLYDAVNRGFAACADFDAMAWIGADDRFEPGAFATVEEIFKSGYRVVDRASNGYLRIRCAGEYIADHSFPAKGHSRRDFRWPIRAAFHRARGHILAPRLWQREKKGVPIAAS
jgi:glycosyltransferase involved in cell wall biosynthesis